MFNKVEVKYLDAAHSPICSRRLEKANCRISSSARYIANVLTTTFVSIRRLPSIFEPVILKPTHHDLGSLGGYTSNLETLVVKLEL